MMMIRIFYSTYDYSRSFPSLFGLALATRFLLASPRCNAFMIGDCGGCSIIKPIRTRARTRDLNNHYHGWNVKSKTRFYSTTGTITTTTETTDAKSDHPPKTTTCTIVSSANAPAAPIGGDYCGLSATFDPRDGSFIPIPDYLIPKDMLEWGQEPSSLEVLISEDIFDSRNREWTRQVTTVFPAIGCTVDNLETKKTIEEVDTCSTWQNGSNNHISVQQSLRYINNHNQVVIETIFGWIIPDHRVRMSVTMDIQDENISPAINKPVTIVLERQVDKDSTYGTIADGGGLDGQRVSRMMGDMLSKQYQNFALSKPSKFILKEKSDSNNNIIIKFPGDVTLSSSWNEKENQFAIEVGYYSLTTSDDDKEGGQQHQRHQHHIVRRTFHSLSPYDTTVESFIKEVV